MYTKLDKIVMWLSTFEFMTYKKAMFIIENFEDLDEFFENIHAYRPILCQYFETSEVEELIKHRSLSYIEKLIISYNKLSIEVVTIKSDKYPELLRETDAPPIMLYCKGDVSLLKSECLAVVGTRRATKYGRDNCRKFVNDIAASGVTIVSGLAEGIDTCAHKACLEVNGKTIAVLGGGLLNIFPVSNMGLAEEILAKGGLIVSEYKPSEQSLTFHFPIRNRIIAGLSKSVFIVEATEKSGSMHTKNYALDYNREVFILPGRVGDIYSVGCNKSIASGHGRMLLNSQEIIDFYGKFNKDYANKTVIQLTYDEQIIYDSLLGEEKHFDELVKITNYEPKVLQTWLMRMTIQGVIDKLPGNYYALKQGDL